MFSRLAHFVTLVLIVSAPPPRAAPSSAHAQRKPRTPVPAGRPLVLLDGTRERDGLRGPVRRVRTEVARVFMTNSGRTEEGRRRLLELTVYDAAGRRVENETYPVVNSNVGQESNEFDDQGNLAETVLRDARGRALSRTVYSYEFDGRGNWTKMVASLSVLGPEGPGLEPFEVTYRAITYYAPASDAPPAVPADRSRARRAQDTAIKTEPAWPDDISSLPDAGDLNDRASSLPPPAYPVGSARRSEVPYVVPVEVIVDEAGRVVSARAARGSRELRAASEEAARRAVFAPFVEEDAPRRVRGTISYSFPYGP